MKIEKELRKEIEKEKKAKEIYDMGNNFALNKKEKDRSKKRKKVAEGEDAADKAKDLTNY